MADQKDGKGSDQLDVDITTNDKVILAEGAKMDRPPPPDYARSNPGTASTYQRVEKGTKTALMYFEGWLNLNDAKEAKDDDYFGGEGGSEKDKKGKKVVRLVSLQTGAGPNGKNWSYGPNGEVIYHRTGFVGLFDKKPDPAKSHMSNVKSAYASQVVYLNKAPTPVSSGPSVGTHHDLMKGPSSGYIDVQPQADGSRRSHTGNTGSAVSTYHDLSKGNKSAYMHAQSQVGAPRPVSPAGPSVGNQNDLMKGTRSSYMDVQQSPTRSGAAKGSQRDHTGLHKLPQYVKNWSYGANGRIIYHKTGFVGYFDKKPPSQRTGNSVMSTVVGGQSQMIDPNGKSTYGSNQKQGKNWYYGANGKVVYHAPNTGVPRHFASSGDRPTTVSSQGSLVGTQQDLARGVKSGYMDVQYTNARNGLPGDAQQGKPKTLGKVQSSTYLSVHK